MDAYHNLAASYDRLTNDVDYEATVAFYEEILKREGLAPRTVVDMACGTGSVSEILARKGYEVTGVDLSEEMLTEAMMKTMDMENRPMFSCQNLRDLRLPKAVDMAVCALDSLDYIFTGRSPTIMHPAAMSIPEIPIPSRFPLRNSWIPTARSRHLSGRAR